MNQIIRVSPSTYAGEMIDCLISQIKNSENVIKSSEDVLFGDDLIAAVRKAMADEDEAGDFSPDAGWDDEVIEALKKLQLVLIEHPVNKIDDNFNLGVYWNWNGWGIEGDTYATAQGFEGMLYTFDNGGQRFDTVQEAVSFDPASNED